MNPRIRLTLFLSFLVLVSILFGGCSRKAQLEAHLQRAEAYFQAGDYASAEIEYLNSLKIDGTSVSATTRLGAIYYDQGRIQKAYPFLLQASKMDPDNLQARYRLGFTQRIAGEFDRAKAQAEYILERDPGHIHGPILLANALIGLEQVEAGIATLDQLKSISPTNASIEVAKAILFARMQGADDATASLEAALELDPRSYYAYSVLGSLYVSQGAREDALKAYERAVEFSPVRSAQRIQLAQLYLASNRAADANRLLVELVSQAPHYVPALFRLAQLRALESDLDAAAKLVLDTLALDPTNHDALILRGSLLLEERKYQEAIDTFVRIASAYRNSPVAHFNLARSYLANKEIAKARASLERALTLNSEYKEAIALMSRLQIQSGDYGGGIVNLNRLLVASPEDSNLLVMLALAYRGQGDYEEAIAIYEKLESAYPDNPQASFLKAQAYARQSELAKAVKAVEAVLRKDPDHLLALEFLVNYLISEKRFTRARELLAARVERQPGNAGFLLIKAKIHIAQEDADAAEALLLKAIKLEPENRIPYLLLTQIYIKDDKRKDALARLEEVIARDPKDVPALMIMCGIYEYQKEYENARYTYEKIVEVNPRFPPALNNLAYLYSEHFDDQDRAFELANRARQFLPDDPSIADTLGWILFKRGDVEWARGIIQESAEKLPGNAEVQYHLGMTHYMLGDEALAREAFGRALELAESFNGKDDVERRLAILEIDPWSSEENLLPRMEDIAKDSKGDPVALVRLARAYEASGERANALDVYDSILAMDESFVPALLDQSKLFAAQGEISKALDLAKRAYKIRPNDPAVAHRLANIAIQDGNPTWASSLLQEATRKKQADLAMRVDLAKSLFALGQVENAKTNLETVVASGVDDTNLDSARRWLGFLNAMSERDAAGRSGEAIIEMASALGSELAARWVEASSALREDDRAEAVRLYRLVLDDYPDFSIAKREIAFAYADSELKIDDETLKRVNDAIQDYRTDSALIAAVGKIAFRNGDFRRAASLLNQPGVGASDDLLLSYYLGMAYFNSGDEKKCVEPLKRAMELGASGAFADEIERVLVSLK